MSNYTHKNKVTNRKIRIVPDTLRGDENIIVAYDMGAYEGVTRVSQEEFSKNYVKIKPWDSCKKDDPVYVHDIDSGLIYAHFARIGEDGFPHVWQNGCTSFTTDFTTRVKSCIPKDVHEAEIKARLK